jgi:tetratricopeptide (TPR) repeat protein
MRFPSISKGIGGSGIGIAAICAAAALAFAPISAAQGYGGSQPAPSQQQQSAKPAQPAAQQPAAQQAEPPKVDLEEEKAFKAFFDLKFDATDRTIQLGEQFIQKYPTSKYAEQVYSRLTLAYYDKQQYEKMYAAADKALELNKDDVTVLVMFGWVIPHKIDPNDMEADRRLAKAEEYEKHALAVLDTLPKPAGMTDELFAKSKVATQSQAHSALGLIYYRLQDPAKSVDELKKGAGTAASPDPTDYYVMGAELTQLKRYPEAADAYEKCSKIPGGLQDRCKQGAEQAKKQAAATPPTPKQ